MAFILLCNPILSLFKNIILFIYYFTCCVTFRTHCNQNCFLLLNSMHRPDAAAAQEGTWRRERRTGQETPASAASGCVPEPQLVTDGLTTCYRQPLKLGVFKAKMHSDHLLSCTNQTPASQWAFFFSFSTNTVNFPTVSLNHLLLGLLTPFQLKKIKG